MSNGFYKAEEVRDAARGRWVDVLARCGVDTSLLRPRHGPCPGCGGKDRFRFDDRDGDGTFICSQGGGGNLAGDGFELLKHVTGKDFSAVLVMAGDVVLGEGGKRRGEGGRRRNPLNEGVARAPEGDRAEWIPEYDEGRLREYVRAVPEEAGEEGWFMARSPVDVRGGMAPGAFLEHVFAPGERILVFTKFASQGQFLWEVGRGGFRLSAERNVQAVRSKLPVDGGVDGAWYLCNPVDGGWYPNPRQGGKYSRRSEESVRGWRHFVLENDEAKKHFSAARVAEGLGKLAEAEALKERGRVALRLWKRFLALVPVPVVAIYSSGGDSWHALCRVEMATKPDFDAYLRGGGGQGPGAKRILPIFGADPGAMSAVRLTRLPGVTRGGRMQRLIYLNPGCRSSDRERIWDRPAVRGD